MYILIAGGGKVGRNLTKDLLAMGHEVTVIEQRADRYRSLEEEFEHVVQHGDATELHVLERCGVRRAGPRRGGHRRRRGQHHRLPGRARWLRRRASTIARVNDPRNQEAFDLLGIAPTVCATQSIMSLIEHELPEPRARDAAEPAPREPRDRRDPDRRGLAERRAGWSATSSCPTGRA